MDSLLKLVKSEMKCISKHVSTESEELKRAIWLLSKEFGLYIG